MIGFVLIAALLALLTLLLLTRPLWLAPRHDPKASPPDSAEALRQQLAQLTALRQAGALGEPQFTEAKVALERRIVEAVVATPTQPSREAATARKPLLIGLSGFVVGVAGVCYLLLGTPAALIPAAAAANAAGPGDASNITFAQIEGMTQKLEARLKEQPDDLEGWTMLGRSYAVLGRHAQAVPAFKQALAMRPDDAVLIADYADALAVANGRNLEGEPSRLIAHALQVDPNNLKALSLAGTAAFVRKDYALALRHWEKMAQVAPGSDYVQQIQAGIDEARSLLAGQGAGTTVAQSKAETRQQSPASAPQPEPAPIGASVSGVVTLAAALAGKAAPSDTVFVFARAAEGSRMPLAILRKQVKDLPLRFTLDDSTAMSPATRLSSAQRVVIGARISKRGEAMPQPGDLQGLSVPVALGASGLKIEIKDVVSP